MEAMILITAVTMRFLLILAGASVEIIQPNGPQCETRTLSLQQSSNLLLQLGQIILDGGPDDFQIDKEILMDRDVAHSAHLRPWKLGMLFDEVGRGAVDLVYGLADDLDIADNRVLGLRVLFKGFEVRDRAEDSLSPA
jgi:hypothetical protein